MQGVKHVRGVTQGEEDRHRHSAPAEVELRQVTIEHEDFYEWLLRGFVQKISRC